MHVIIDADPLVYRAGYAAERVEYEAVAEDAAGNVLAANFAAASDVQDWIEQNNLTLLDREKHITPEPVENALQIAKAIIGSIVDAVVKYSGHRQHSSSILLSGPDNFRERIATIRPYKGNRDPDAKPVHYQALRDYLTGQFGAVVVHGREADDEASILAWRRAKSSMSYVVASNDKDLDQIPGTHYDIRVHAFYEVKAQDADDFFWQQVLSGDMTDNVPGAKGIGAAKARRIVEQAREDGLDDSELWDVILSYFPSEAAAIETARLVYLQREPNELWTPPGVPREYLEESLDD